MVMKNIKKFIPSTIKTKRLILRKPRLSDAPEVFEYSSDSEATKFMTWKPHKNINESKKFIKNCLKEWKENKNDGWFTWFMTTKRSDKNIGNISLKIKNTKASFGYILSTKKWGKGYMSEALKAVVDLALTLPEIKLIWGVCDASNKASSHVMKKAGLKFKRLKKKNSMRNVSDKPRDTKLYILKKSS